MTCGTVRTRGSQLSGHTWLVMLQVRELSVEVGGRTVVDGASFVLRSGDKVGLVGRNGAGKTSLLKVLAGEAPSIGGTVLRRGNLGYLRQDPRLRRGESATSSLAHVLSGRGLDEAPGKLEKLRLAMEESPSTRNVARYSRAEEEYRHAGGYSAESEARSISHGLGLPLDRLDEADAWAVRAAELGPSAVGLEEMLWRQVKAKVHARRGEHAEAERLAREAVAICDGTEMLNAQGDVYADLGEVLVLAGKPDEAAAALEQAFERYERKGNIVSAERVQARLEELREAASR